MNQLHFTWSEKKNLSNQKKHKVSFEEAKTAFIDEFARLIADPEHSDKEERFILLGMSSRLKILTVSHCEIDSDTIRIISARKADKNERNHYEGKSHA